MATRRLRFRKLRVGLKLVASSKTGSTHHSEDFHLQAGILILCNKPQQDSCQHLTTSSSTVKNPSCSSKMGSLFSTEEKPTHTKARNPDYPGTTVKRFLVSDEYVSWDVEYPGYKPVDYTDPKVLSKPVWADVDVRKEKPKSPLQYNQLDKEHKVDRRSHGDPYKVIDGVPRNPVGRTGMTGRGLLGRWGPNHAADPIVTRWKLDGKGNKVLKNGHPVLEFVSIQRRDTGEWAVPGGMVDPGDSVPNTLKKEFGEEALDSIEASDEVKKKISEHIDQLFKEGQEIFRGYVDDPRNTDNSWMETVAVNFHDDTGSAFNKIPLKAGDDAKAVQWLEADHSLNLYASHSTFIEKACKLHDAHF